MTRPLLPMERKYRMVVCAGMTHPAHNEEIARVLNVAPMFHTRPAFFVKAPSALIGHGDPIRIPDVSRLVSPTDWTPPFGQVTCEVELAVVMARAGSRIDPERVMDSVLGFTVFNDVSQRDVQRLGYPTSLCKGFATFGPLGPAIVPRDDAPDVQARQFELRVNGEIRQSGSLRELMYSIEQLVSLASHVFDLGEGDVVTTGSPAGMFHYSLAPGDVVEAEIEGIGVLRNPVVATDR